MHSPDIYSVNGAVAALLVFAGLRDVATRCVPNWVSIMILAFGMILHIVSGGLVLAISLGVLVFSVSALMWLRGWLGGADVKLLGAASVAASPGEVGHLLVTISLAGGVLALVYIVLSRFVHRPLPGPRTGILPRLIKAEAWRIHRRAPLPYAVAIAIGGVFTLFPS